MNITTIEVAGFSPAIKGMRNPMNSWHRSDTQFYSESHFEIGQRDMQLMTNLVKSGPEHAKYLRQIQVWADFDMPRYWWSECDTYKFGVSNSCSTMHKLFTERMITLDEFVFDSADEYLILGVVARLNELRREYLVAKDEKDNVTMDKLKRRGKQLLPEGFLQLRTRNTNYAELMNMYHQRKNHRLKEEWVDTFCTWCETLPYFKELCIDPVEDK